MEVSAAAVKVAVAARDVAGAVRDVAVAATEVTIVAEDCCILTCASIDRVLLYFRLLLYSRHPRQHYSLQRM